MTVKQFRTLALSFPEATEAEHMGHPDFRVKNKIFATLGVPDKKHCMVKLTPDQQVSFVHTDPEVFKPVAGGWGRRGATFVHLPDAEVFVVHQALVAAWRNTAPKKLVREYDADQSR
jgi:hypothetical protein